METEHVTSSATALSKAELADALATHMPLVHRIVAQFVRRLPRSVQREDLVAAGMIGLFHALRASAHTCPEMFASYARIRIRGSIVDELRRNDWSPRRRKEKSADASNVTPIHGHMAYPISVIGFDDLPPELALALGHEQTSSPFDELVEKRTLEALRAGLEALPARERAIVRMRYFKGIPSTAIAAALGLSEARISQLHGRATERLREFLSGGFEDLNLAA